MRYGLAVRGSCKSDRRDKGLKSLTRQALAAPPGPRGMPCTGPDAATGDAQAALPAVCAAAAAAAAAIPRPARRFGLAGRSGRLRPRQPPFAAPAARRGRLRCPPPPASLPACAAYAASGMACGARRTAGAGRGPPAAVGARIFLPPYAGPAPLPSPPPLSLPLSPSLTARPGRATRRAMRPEATARRLAASCARYYGGIATGPSRQQRPPCCLLSRRKGAARLRYLRQQRPPRCLLPPHVAGGACGRRRGGNSARLVASCRSAARDGDGGAAMRRQRALS